MFLVYRNVYITLLHKLYFINAAKSAGAEEYTDCISAER